MGRALGAYERQESKENIQRQTGWSKKSWKTEIATGRWCSSRHENIRGQELEEGRPRPRRMGKAS